MEGHLALNYSPDGAFSPDGAALAVVEEKRVIVVNLSTGRPQQILRPAIAGIASLNLESANYVAPNRLFMLAHGLEKARGGRGEVSTPELAFQWDTTANSLLGKLDAIGAQGGFLPSRYFPRLKNVALYKAGVFTFWNPVTGLAQRFNLPALTHPAHLFAISPDGEWLILAQIETNASPNPVVISTRQHAFVNVLGGHHGTVLSINFARDGKMVETSCEDGKVRLWSVPEWKLLATLSGNQGPVHWAEFSPDGRYVASAGEDDTARIWAVATGALVQTLEESRQPLLTVAFSPTGQYLAASAENEVHVWSRTAVSAR